MSFLKEFREFAVKGNVVDMAVGVVIGAAFGKIVSSLVADIITPPIGWLIGGVDFSHLAVTLTPPIEGMQAVTIKYGLFLQQIFDFSIVAFALFMLVKAVNILRRTTPPPPAMPTTQEVLLTEIRDLLKDSKGKA